MINAAKMVNNMDLLYSTGNYTEHFVITYMGKNLEKKKEYICWFDEKVCLALNKK